MNRTVRFNLLYFLIAAFAIMAIHDVWVNYNQISHIPYSEFDALLNSGKVKEVVVSDEFIQGTLKTPDEKGRTQFITARVETDLSKLLNQSNVKYSRAVENTFLRELASWLIPVFIFVAIWMFLMRRLSKTGGLGGQFMSVGKSKAKIYVEDDTKTTFKDVAGVEEAKDELVEVVNFLKDPASSGRLGGRMPKGTLLIGPPGTGKTLLAKAVAGEAGVPFFSISGSEFVEMFVGVGAARVRDLFEQARQKAPCIIFIDELDALGRSRSSGGFSGGHDEKEQTLNQLLVEMDGFDSNKVGIVLLAATNRPEILDPALLRAGRFDRQVLVDKPDKKGRIEILSVHSKRIVMSPDVDMSQVAALTPGFTGADLANLVNEAALAATRRKADMVTLSDFNEAVERIVAGLEKKNRILNQHERKVVAYHEMGHALLGAALPGSDTVHKVSIIPRGMGALGYTIQRPLEDRYLITIEELQNRMAVLLGGRAAEKLVFGHISSGASDDIAKATNIARTMVARFGMDETLGNVAYDQEPQSFLGGPGAPSSRSYSEHTAREMDSAIKRYVDESLRKALGILEKNMDLLKESAERLIEKETLDEAK